METKRTLIRGLAIDVIVVETMQTDAAGTLFYIAMIYAHHRKTGIQRLIRRTRISGSGQALATEVQEQGLRALEAFKAVV